MAGQDRASPSPSLQDGRDAGHTLENLLGDVPGAQLFVSLITQRKPLWVGGGGTKKEEPTLHLVQVTHPGTKDTLWPLNCVTQGSRVECQEGLV